MHQRTYALCVTALAFGIFMVGCAQPPRTAYEKDRAAELTHDQAAQSIRALGGRVTWEQQGVAVTLFPADAVTARSAMALVPDLHDVAAVSLIQKSVIDVDLSYLGDEPNLRYLLVRDARITAGGWKYLGSLPHLTALHLFDTGLDDARLADVVARVPQLETLTIGYDAVTDAGLKSLARLIQLHELTLTHTKVTRAAAMKLLDANPYLVLHYEDETIAGPKSGQ